MNLLQQYIAVYSMSSGIRGFPCGSAGEESACNVGEEKIKSLSHVQLCNPMDCSPPGSSIHGIFQARVLEWVAISFWVQSLGWEDFLEKRKATPSSILAWRIPWTV